MIGKGDIVTLFMAGDCYREGLPSSDLVPVKCRITEVKTDLRGITLYGFESVDPGITWRGRTGEQFIFESDKFAQDLDLIDKGYQRALENVCKKGG